MRFFLFVVKQNAPISSSVVGGNTTLRTIYTVMRSWLLSQKKHITEKVLNFVDLAVLQTMDDIYINKIEYFNASVAG